ncbi:hypothetical protein [Streptomyces bacillaris]|uniref:hypothetical protein n=1 Tax=Streptomyces bacillaris TaxID=68179 RepID=UPI003460A63B
MTSFDATREYGPLLFRAENPTEGMRRRTVRWLALVVLAAALVVTAFSSAFMLRESGGPPSWWVYVLLWPGGFLTLWAIFEFLGLLTAWWHVGWSVDVHERGVVESRFGTVRQAMPFSGGVIDQNRTLFTSPRPDVGTGRLTASWRGELKEVPSKIRATAQAVLVREALARLRSGQSVAFPGRREPNPGIMLTPDQLKLPDGREFEYSRMRIQYYIALGDGEGNRLTDDPAKADGFHILTDNEDPGFRTRGGYAVPGLERRSPNRAVVREVLSILIDPDGHRTMYRAQHAPKEQAQP